jgi:cardiolipin synthase
MTLLEAGASSPQPALETRQPGLAPVTLEVAGHELTLFVEALPLITSMILDIRSAQQRVWLETYIFHDDAAGQAVAEALKERARAGVEVRLLFDAIGSQATPAALFDDLRRAGVQVHEYHSFWEALWRISPLRILNRRNHRKLLVIDDRVGYFGGMNVVDASSALTIEQAEHLPLSAGWRDVHVRLIGPQQAELAESFDRSWRSAHGEKISRRPKAYRQAQLAPLTQPSPPADGGEGWVRGEESIQFFDSGPGLKHTRAGRLFTQLIRAARKRLTLSMAYFLPVGMVLRNLVRARRRGVFVRVVVPGQSDVAVVQHATRHLYSVLLHRRFRIYERQVNMLHSKVMIVDDRWSVVGSCNLDARSLWINLEFVAVIQSRKLAGILNDIVAYEIAHSKRVTYKAYRERSWWRRLVNRLAWMLRWWL